MLPSGWIRSTLPLRLFLFCALLPFCASPVLANRNWPSGENRSRPASGNLLRRMPESRTCSVLVTILSVAGSYLIRTIRLSDDDVCMMYSQWSLLNVLGLISRPVRPPSPPVLCAFGTVPRFFLAPVAGLRWMMSCVSRRLYMIVPSGSVTRPHGMSVSVVIWVTVQTSVHRAPVLTDTVLLCPDLLPAESRATTKYENVVFAARPPSLNDVPGGVPTTPVTEPTWAPSRKMSYAMTWTLSVEAVHVSDTLVLFALPVRLVGLVGGWVSEPQAGGVMFTVSLACETLPAASRACTYRPHGTPGTTVRLVDVVLPPTDLMSWPSWKMS